MNRELSHFYHTPDSFSVDAAVAQIMGHSSPGILQTYAKAIDEFRRSAISKLESFCEGQSIESAGRSEKDATILIQ